MKSTGEALALAVAAAGIVFMLLAALGWATSPAPAPAAAPFGAEVQPQEAAPPAPRKEISAEPSPLAKSLLREAKRAVRVADALLGSDVPGGEVPGTTDLLMMALAAAGSPTVPPAAPLRGAAALERSAA